MKNFYLIKFKDLVEKLIFASKWMLVPFYIKLMWTLVILLYDFVTEGHISNEDMMSTLEDVDIVMIANLVKMIITGSYHSFVTKDHGEDEHASSGVLKIKMATSIIGVSAIHLLQTFIDAHNIPMEDVYKQIMIHGMFIIGAVALAFIDKNSSSNH